MWFFMITCYVLNLLSFLMLLATGLQGYLAFRFFSANHPTFALLTIIIYLFTQTLVIFFFVGIGVSIRDYVAENKLNADYHRRSIRIKQQLYPPLLLNILILMILFISGGATHTDYLPKWIHALLFYIAMTHFAYVIRIQHSAFKESTNIVLEMSGVKR